MQEILYMTKGPRGRDEHRTNGYLLTLTRDGDVYRAYWHYPNDPMHPSNNGTPWTLAQVQSNVAQGLWQYRFPPTLNLPNGA